MWAQQKAPQCSELLGGGSPMPIRWIVTTKSPPELPGGSASLVESLPILHLSELKDRPCMSRQLCQGEACLVS